MGMFDWITCDVPLPVPGLEGVKWQTKSLECEMVNYRITADGALERRFGGEWEPAHAPHWLIVYFYEMFDKEKNEAGRVLSSRWVEFCAHFTHGKLDGIDLIEDRIHVHPTDEEIERKRREMDEYLSRTLSEADLEGPFSTHDPEA